MIIGLWPSLGLGQADSGFRPERLYLTPGVLLGSSRVASMGGAYVGVAEGAGGMPTNLAVLANRSPTLDRWWNVGFTLSWYNVPPGVPRQDVENDGLVPQTQQTFQGLIGMMFQYKWWGIGAYVRQDADDYCSTDACIAADIVSIHRSRAALAVGTSFAHDTFVVGFGFFSAGSDFLYHGETWRYTGTGLEVDGLYRPNGQPFRIGLSIKPKVLGTYQPRPGQVSMVAGRSLFSGVLSPWIISLGVSLRLGAGAFHHNRLSPAALREWSDQPADLVVPKSGEPTGRWLVSLQGDAILSVGNAVPVKTFTAGLEPDVVGAPFAVVPRLGVEHDTIVDHLRSRLGTFLEPSLTRVHGPRPHLTGGLELYVFHLVVDWSVAASLDLARNYSNVGLSIGFW